MKVYRSTVRMWASRFRIHDTDLFPSCLTWNETVEFAEKNPQSDSMRFDADLSPCMAGKRGCPVVLWYLWPSKDQNRVPCKDQKIVWPCVYFRALQVTLRLPPKDLKRMGKKWPQDRLENFLQTGSKFRRKHTPNFVQQIKGFTTVQWPNLTLFYAYMLALNTLVCVYILNGGLYFI